MRRIETQKKDSIVLPVIIAMIVGAGVTYFFQNTYYKNFLNESKNVERLTKQADVLLSGFIQLQNLNDNYAAIVSDKNLDSAGLKRLNALNILITNKQLSFRQSLDSLQSKKNNYDKNSYILLTKITDAYVAALTQSNSINTTRNSVNIGNTNYTFDKGLLNSLQNELHKKQLELINLGSGNKAEISSDYKGMMQQQDSVVSQVLQNQNQKNKNLSDYSDKLKRDNDLLAKELQALKQSNVLTQNNAEATVTKSQLSDQLSLAQVDCNLARADARKTVSNSKQRRELLQQALEILNQLSQSGNQSIKEQAQFKMNELKTIAANNHD